MPFLKPCLDCGALSRANRCETHQKAINDKKERLRDTPERRAKKQQYYNSDYRKRAKRVRQTATICHICGGGEKPDDPWQADHLQPGDALSPLLPSHRSCNASRGDKPLPNTR